MPTQITETQPCQKQNHPDCQFERQLAWHFSSCPGNLVSWLNDGIAPGTVVKCKDLHHLAKATGRQSPMSSKCSEEQKEPGIVAQYHNEPPFGIRTGFHHVRCQQTLIRSFWSTRPELRENLSVENMWFLIYHRQNLLTGRAAVALSLSACERKRYFIFCMYTRIARRGEEQRLGPLP